MPKQLNVNLAFSADTAEAKKAIDDLNRDLKSIASLDAVGGLTPGIQSAVSAAKDLQIHLNNAFDIKTGNFDLSRLNSSLKSSGQSLSELSNKLLNAGMTGESAFLNLSKSISRANINLTKSQGLLGSFITTLKNTARWQLSSSVLHGFIGATQSAISYTEDLNKSLNNIRIVTGQNSDQMAKFAESANKAAKELNTTTTKYTDAALIFYQQGLDDSAVKERTDAVIKMANVTGDTSSEVSSYMTAIWNNFDDGSESLEHYADVITALGASTASSSAEIAAGLEKFASVAESIGLSYEYSTSALATIVANTRQSADTVGTGLRTIFSRLQGLSLGDTLDDGTDLNKYSKALMTAGVNIKDVSGDLKNMDTILEELAGRWQVLSRDQQVALAQTVGGVRQYTNLIALMDNWGDMEENLLTANNAEGSLQKQADIYAESWKAAKEKVRSSLQGLYNDLIPTDAIIKMTNGFASVISILDKVIETFGGLKSIILLVATISVNKFQANLASAIDTSIFKVRELGTSIAAIFKNGMFSLKEAHLSNLSKKGNADAVSAAGQRQIENYEQNGKNSIQKDYTNSLQQAAGRNDMTAGFKAQIKNLQEIDKLQSKIQVNSDNLTIAEKKKLETQLQQVQALGEQEAKLIEQADIIKDQIDALKDKDREEVFGNIGDVDVTDEQNVTTSRKKFLTVADDSSKKSLEEASANIDAINELLAHSRDKVEGLSIEINKENQTVRLIVNDEEEIVAIRERALQLVSDTSSIQEEINNAIRQGTGNWQGQKRAIEEIVNKAKENGKLTQQQADSILAATASYRGGAKELSKIKLATTKVVAESKRIASTMGSGEKTIAAAAERGHELGKAMIDANTASSQTRNAIDQVSATISKAAERALSFSGAISGMISNITSFAMAATQISNFVNNLQDPDISWTQKLMSGAMAASAALAFLNTTTKALQGAMTAINSIQAAGTVISSADVVVKKKLTQEETKAALAKMALTAAQKISKGATEEDTLAELTNQITKKTGIAGDKAAALAKVLLSGAKKISAAGSREEASAETFDTMTKEADTKATIGLTLATYGLNVPLLILMGILIALTAIIIGIISAINKHNEVEEKARQKSIEAGKAAKEEADANRELIDTYEEAYKVYKETGEGKQALVDAAAKVCEAYGIEGAALAELTGDYEALTEAIRQARLEELKGSDGEGGTIADLEAAKNAAAYSFVEAMKKDVGHASGDKEYIAKIGGGTTSGDEEKAQKIVNNGNYKYLSTDGNDINIKTGLKTEEMVAAYHEAEDVLAEMQRTMTTSEMASSENYKNLVEWIEKSTEAITAYEEAMANLSEVESEVVFLEEGQETGIKPEDIDSVQKYTQYRQQLIDRLAKERGVTAEMGEEYKKVQDDIDAILTNDSFLGKYAQINKALDDAAEKTGIDRLHEIYDGLSDEEKEVFFSINFDGVKTEEQLRKQLDLAQALANAEQLEVKVNVVREAKNNLSEDMTASDYSAFKDESGINWGEDGVIEYSEFLTKSYQEQVNYLNSLEQEYLSKQKSSLSEAMSANEALINEYQSSIDALKAESDAGGLDEASIAENTAQIAEYQALISGLEEQNAQLDAEAQMISQDIVNNALSAATTLEELKNAWNTALLENNGEALDYSAYAEALTELASQYDNCAEEIEKFNNAVMSGDTAAMEAAEHELNAAIMIGEATDKYGLSADSLEIQAKELRNASKDVNGEMTLTAEQAAILAIQNQRLNKGLTKLVDNWADWKKVLKSTDKTSQDYADTLADLSDSVQDLIGWYDDLALSSDFVDENMDLIEKSSKGDMTAIMQLGAAVASLSIKEAELNTTLASGAMANGDKNAFQQYIGDAEDAGIAFQNLQNSLSGVFDNINSHMAELQANPGLLESLVGEGGIEEFVNQLNAYAAATGMTAQEMQSMLSSVGVTANVQSDYQEQDVQVPTYLERSQVVGWDTYEMPKADGSGTITQRAPIIKRSSTPGPVETHRGFVEVASISLDGEGEGLGVSAPRFTGRQAPSASAKKGSSGGGGGGGGGSSSPPKYNEEKYKNTRDEKERYHVIKNQLEDLSSQYENISKAKDKAFGAARLANLNKEISAQKKLTQANKEYLSEIEKYLAEDKAAVKALGADIDANGTITNYDALVQKAVNDYNAAVDAFNRATTDDEGAQKAFEAAQERYDQFMKTISQYEETQDLYKEQMQQILDDIITEQSLLLERTQLEVELKINVSEDALQYLEYMMDNIENKAYDCAEAFGYLNGMTQEYFKTAEALEGGLRSLFANQGLTDTDFQKLIEGDTATYNKLMDMLSSGGTADLSDGLQQSEIDAAYGFTADDVDTMRDYVSQLIEANQNLQEIRQTVHEQILNVWDEWNEKLDAGIAKIEHLQSITESYQNIIDIVGQKNLGVSNAFMSKMRQQSIDQANDKLEAEKARYESLKKARDDAYAKFEEQKAKGILSPEEIKQWEDSLAQMDEDVQSASESFQSAWEDALTAANEAFEAAVDQIMQVYDDAAAGLMGSMSDLQDAFDRKSDISSQYLADYEKIYQLTKLNRDLENSIDSTSNTKAKAELLELQSKINAYEEAGIDISEYQMEQLRQEYELKKAQIELEESQEAKSQVQMTRDADGNYSYVYTANADDVAKAEQNYEDKLHQMQESNANYINDLQSNMIQMEQDYQDKVQEIMKDTSLTAEERMVKLNELNQYYDEKMKFYMSEAELWEENSQRLYEEDWMNYAAATGYKISSEEEWLDHWNETQLSILTGFGSLEEYQANHNMNVANLLLSSSDAFATWQTNIETAMQNAGTSMADFEEDATDVLGTVAEESEKTKDSVVNMAEKATNAIGEVVNAVVDWENQYSATVQKMLAWNNALITSFNKLIAGWSAVQSSANSSGAGSGSGNGSGSGSGNGSNSGNGFNSSSGNSNGSNGGSGVDNSDKVAGVAAAIWLDGDASGWGNNPTRTSRLKEKGVEGAQAYINAHGANGDIYADWASKKGQLRKYYYGSFDTGGYTGEWGLDGKFAMLHEKELVLNKDDTTHFLQAIDIVRQISELIDLNALSSAGGLSSLLAATASSSSQKLEQQVTIHAEFPNVTDKDQITEAFTDLVNLASQYANRK